MCVSITCLVGRCVSVSTFIMLRIPSSWVSLEYLCLVGGGVSGVLVSSWWGCVGHLCLVIRCLVIRCISETTFICSLYLVCGCLWSTSVCYFKASHTLTCVRLEGVCSCTTFTFAPSRTA